MTAQYAKTCASETKRALLDAAVKHMLQKGFTATTVDDICEGAGVTKGCFFYYFENKEELVKAALRHFRESQQSLFDGAAFRSLADPLDRVYGRLDFMMQIARNENLPTSCLVGNLAQEVSGTHEEIRCVCECALDSTASDFERDLAAARLKHTPEADFSPASVARLYVTLIQGSLVLAKALKKRDVFVENMGHFRRYIDGLFGKTETTN